MLGLLFDMVEAYNILVVETYNKQLYQLHPGATVFDIFEVRKKSSRQSVVQTLNSPFLPGKEIKLFLKVVIIESNRVYLENWFFIKIQSNFNNYRGAGKTGSLTLRLSLFC